MPRAATWYFDFISPFAYLQFQELGRLPVKLDLTFRPVLFAGLLGHWGQLGPVEIPAKKRHTAMMVRWRADRRGIPLTPPLRHPFNPLALLRLAISLRCTREAVGTIFAHVWAEGNDGQSTESLTALAGKLGIGDLETRLADPAVKAELRSNTEAAIAQGAYGVPTLALGDELFWGDDMLEIALDYLENPGMFANEDYRRILDMEPAVERPRAKPAKMF